MTCVPGDIGEELVKSASCLVRDGDLGSDGISGPPSVTKFAPGTLEPVVTVSCSGVLSGEGKFMVTCWTSSLKPSVVHPGRSLGRKVSCPKSSKVVTSVACLFLLLLLLPPVPVLVVGVLSPSIAAATVETRRDVQGSLDIVLDMAACVGAEYESNLCLTVVGVHGETLQYEVRIQATQVNGDRTRDRLSFFARRVQKRTDSKFPFVSHRATDRLYFFARRVQKKTDSKFPLWQINDALSQDCESREGGA